jgi:hypothetical protein
MFATGEENTRAAAAAGPSQNDNVMSYNKNSSC